MWYFLSFADSFLHWFSIWFTPEQWFWGWFCSPQGTVSNTWRHIWFPWLKVKVKLLSRILLFVTSWTVAYQAPQSMGFSRQEYWSGVPFPSPGDLSDPGIKPMGDLGSIRSHMIEPGFNHMPIVGICFTVWANRDAYYVCICIHAYAYYVCIYYVYAYYVGIYFTVWANRANQVSYDWTWVQSYAYCRHMLYRLS